MCQNQSNVLSCAFYPPYSLLLLTTHCTLLLGISKQGNASVIPAGVLILPPALNALEHQVMQIFCFPCVPRVASAVYMLSQSLL